MPEASQIPRVPWPGLVLLIFGVFNILRGLGFLGFHEPSKSANWSSQFERKRVKNMLFKYQAYGKHGTQHVDQWSRFTQCQSGITMEKSLGSQHHYNQICYLYRNQLTGKCVLGLRSYAPSPVMAKSARPLTQWLDEGPCHPIFLATVKSLPV